jgi:hypothetical protein
MRIFAWVLLLAWVAAGLWYFAADAPRRFRKDLAIARIPVERVSARRGRAWGWEPEIERQVRGIEAASRELREQHFRRVLLLAPPNTNPFQSIAVHVLFPTHVVISAREGRGLRELREEADAAEASALLFRNQENDWAWLPLAPEDAPEDADGRALDEDETPDPSDESAPRALVEPDEGGDS